MRLSAPLPPVRRVAPSTTLIAVLCAAILASPMTVAAQRADAPRIASAGGDACDYRSCAYNIIAALHGLRVVRGERETQVATLGFLWTRDISDAFDGEGRSAAQAAVRARRWGALFTDLGLALLLTGAVSAATQDLDETSAKLMLAGAASVGVSVPIQFLADKHLARAVWQHNARFAVEPR